jgi:hypothetical protein
MARTNRWLRVVAASILVAGVAISGFGAAKSLPQDGKNAGGGELPYVVTYENGANKFLAGDDITITEVRGTAEKIAPGNIYCIKGTYKLASRDKALLAAYITANNAADGRSKSLRVQHMNVSKGDGTFTLYLPMYIEGWPHVSFYSDQEGIGGRYFGSGKYLLERWWGSAETKTDTVGGLRKELERLENRIRVLESRSND